MGQPCDSLFADYFGRNYMPSALALAVKERQRATSSSHNGIAFTQVVKAIALGESLFGAQKPAAELWGPASLAARAVEQAIELEHKGGVSPGTLTDSTWAGPLAVATNEIIELVRQASVIGRIPGLRRAPIGVKVSPATSGS